MCQRPDPSQSYSSTLNIIFNSVTDIVKRDGRQLESGQNSFISVKKENGTGKKNKQTSSVFLFGARNMPPTGFGKEDEGLDPLVYPVAATAI